MLYQYYFGWLKNMGDSSSFSVGGINGTGAECRFSRVDALSMPDFMGISV
jgi:hypothetical protein